MGGRRRTVIYFGYVIDRSDGGRCVNRLVADLDKPHNAACRERTIDEVLKSLSGTDRAFARRVLDGLTWTNTRLTKRSFNKRLGKIIEKVIRARLALVEMDVRKS